MASRPIGDGLLLHEVPNANGGFTYYLDDGNPEGMVKIGDTGVAPVYAYAEMNAMMQNPNRPKEPIVDMRPHFNPSGFRN